MSNRKGFQITPNQITILRLLLAVLFFAILGRYCSAKPVSSILDWALLIFIVAGLTDLLDGYLARRLNLESSIGRILDPFVDKVLTCGAFMFFIGVNFVDSAGVNVTGVAPWMVVVIVSRELLVTGLRGFSEARGTQFGATISGKIKMFLQSVTIGYILLSLAHFSQQSWAQWIRLILIWLMLVFTAGSMLGYLRRSRKVLTEADRESSEEKCGN